MELGIKEVFLSSFFKSFESNAYYPQLSDWYLVRSVDVKSHGGLGLFNYYRTLGDALQSTYTDYAWDPKRFVPEMRRHSTLLKELSRAESKLGINQVLISKDDSYNLLPIESGGRLVLRVFGRAERCGLPNQGD